VRQGEIWWGDQPDEKSRPYVVLTRDEAIPVVHSVLVAPLTRRQRGIATELKLDSRDGVPSESCATFDNVRTIRKSHLTRRVGELDAGRWHEVCAAMRAAIDC
jgi:mRNA interferase MazF